MELRFIFGLRSFVASIQGHARYRAAAHAELLRDLTLRQFSFHQQTTNFFNHGARQHGAHLTQTADRASVFRPKNRRALVFFCSP